MRPRRPPRFSEHVVQPRAHQTARGVARERWIVAAVISSIVMFRSGIFVFWPQAHFDADSAVTGLMATHISQGRAFPVFWYGQSYMLAVESYLAAPLFLVFGPSVTALKLPLLAINLAVSLLLLRVLERDGGLRPALAVLPVLFFALPAPGTSARLLEANGGNLEPFLYVLLLWMLRKRPVWCGVVLGVGFLHREFTIYGLVALLVIEGARGRLTGRADLKRWATTLGVAGVAWVMAQGLKHFSAAAGPGTALKDVYRSQSNVLELASRVCFDLAATLHGIPLLTTDHWPALFGTARLALLDFGIDSAAFQGLEGSGTVLVGLLAIAGAFVARRLVISRAWTADYDVSAYLLLVAFLSLAGYVVGRCGEVGFYWMRYDLLGLLSPVGLSAWFLRAHPPRLVQAAWTALLVGWLAVPGLAHGRLWIEYLRNPPVGGKQTMIRHLDAAGTRYVLTDYWIAYPITFLTNERIVAASIDFVRIPEYNRIVEAHRAEAVRISRTPCPGGTEVMRRVWFCSP